jgi:hypothetical protein
MQQFALKMDSIRYLGTSGLSKERTFLRKYV